MPVSQFSKRTGNRNLLFFYCDELDVVNRKIQIKFNSNATFAKYTIHNHRADLRARWTLTYDRLLSGLYARPITR